MACIVALFTMASSPRMVCVSTENVLKHRKSSHGNNGSLRQPQVILSIHPLANSCARHCQEVALAPVMSMRSSWELCATPLSTLMSLKWLTWRPMPLKWLGTNFRCYLLQHDFPLHRLNVSSYICNYIIISDVLTREWSSILFPKG